MKTVDDCLLIKELGLITKMTCLFQLMNSHSAHSGRGPRKKGNDSTRLHSIKQHTMSYETARRFPQQHAHTSW